MPTSPSTILKGIVPYWRQLYYQWKSLRNIPLRKRFFIGYDLEGNTYWEMPNYNNPYQMRRILFPRNSNSHLADCNPPPQWLQWLRHTRPNAPDLKELVDDKNRQIIIKLKAAEAERRWKEIPLKGEEVERSGLEEKSRLAEEKRVSEAQRSMDGQRSTDGYRSRDGHKSMDEQRPTDTSPKPQIRKPVKMKF